jgi:importin-5
MKLDGQRVTVRTAALEEKNQAFETLAIHSSTLGPAFSPYLSQTLELALPALRFYFHDGVREASSMYVVSPSSAFLIIMMQHIGLFHC